MIKRKNYVVIYHSAFEEKEEIELVILTRDLGVNLVRKLNRQIACILGMCANVEETYGMDSNEMYRVLKEIYGYEVIDRKDMIEPNRYMMFDLYDLWERYAQIDKFREESDNMYVNGLKELVEEIVKESEG